MGAIRISRSYGTKVVTILRDEKIVEMISNVVKELDSIDEFISVQSQEFLKVEEELLDYYHLIENNELSDSACIEIVKRIHNARKIRRSLKKEAELERTYSTYKSRLTGTDTRQFLLAEVYKTRNSLNTTYKNRIITDEDVNGILNSPSKKRGRPRKEKNNE